jgi:hypothetical protein
MEETMDPKHAPVVAVERAVQISRQPIFPKKDVLAKSHQI